MRPHSWVNDTSKQMQETILISPSFWGSPQDLSVIASTLRAKHTTDTLHILVAKRNSGNYTYDGIELGGERVCQEIEEEISSLKAQGCEIKKLSLVGYSLGGLVARYAVGLLNSKGVFETITPVVSQVTSQSPKINPLSSKKNFTTFVTPHLGVRAPLRGWQNSIWNIFGARTLLTSGRQLFMIDDFRSTGRPLLSILADPDSIFIQGLSKFQRRTLYTNIVNDRSAVYYTTSISKTDPFTNLDKIDISYLQGYEDVILDPAIPIKLLDSEAQISQNKQKAKQLVQSTQTQLLRLPFVLALISYIPIGILTVLINSSLQALQSQQRIRAYEKGLTDIEPSHYRVPLLITNIQSTIGEVYESVNNAQSHEYLASQAEEELQDSGVLVRNDESGFATLALAESQFKMIRALDEVGWRKCGVHIRKARHSHAAIIVRTEKESFGEGRVVLRHWVEEEFIL